MNKKTIVHLLKDSAKYSTDMAEAAKFEESKTFWQGKLQGLEFAITLLSSLDKGPRK